MENKEKQIQEVQSKIITEGGGQNFKGEKIFEKAIPVQTIPKALIDQQQTSSIQNQNSENSNNSSGQTSTSNEKSDK